MVSPRLSSFGLDKNVITHEELHYSCFSAGKTSMGGVKRSSSRREYHYDTREIIHMYGTS
jgi:hypothetical protein